MAFVDGTVLVLGAGASFDFGMPLGAGLANSIRKGGAFRFDISTVVQGDKDLFGCLKRTYRTDDQMLSHLIRGMQRIAAGIATADSIDSFIDRHAGDAEVAEAGKFMIAHYILAAERSSSLRRDPDRIDKPLFLPDCDKTWLGQLRSILFDGVPKSRVGDLGKGLTIITFNYDRCLERYLQEAIRQGFEMSAAEAHGIVREMDITHVYGSLGPLPAEGGARRHESVAYGEETGALDLANVASRIRTFSEQVDTNVADGVRRKMGAATNIVFLGFGFLPANLRLLQPTGTQSRSRPYIYASGVGISDQERQSLNQQLRRLGGVPASVEKRHIHVEIEKDCKALLSIHRRNLLAN